MNYKSPELISSRMSYGCIISPLQRPHFFTTYIEALEYNYQTAGVNLTLNVRFFFMKAIKKRINFSFEGESNYTQAVKLQMMKRCTPSE